MIEEKEDFFEQIPEEKPKKEKLPKAPRLYDDDPRYYEREESRWEHLKPSPYRRGPILWIVGGVLVVMCILISLYIYFFSPVVQEARQYGYVENIQKEGTFFTTYEGVIIPYRNAMDTVRPYDGDFVFSTRDADVATKLVRHEGTGYPVKVTYEVYRTKMPWRGKTKVIVTGIDSIEDPSKLLPPDRRPEYPGSPAETSTASSPQSGLQ